MSSAAACSGGPDGGTGGSTLGSGSRSVGSPSIILAGKASAGAGPSPADVQQVSGENACFFDCGMTSDMCQLINMGNARSVKLVCSACLSAKKAIDSQGRATPENKVALQNMKALRQAEYKELVRMSRIKPVKAGSSVGHSQRNGLLAKTLVSWTTTASGFKDHYIIYLYVFKYIYIYITCLQSL